MHRIDTKRSKLEATLQRTKDTLRLVPLIGCASLQLLCATLWFGGIYPEITHATPLSTEHGALRRANAIATELARVFGVPKHTLPPLVIRSVPDADEDSILPRNSRAMYSRGVIYLKSSLLKSTNLEYALRHEIVHWIVDSISKGRCPAWLDEGLAQVLGGPQSHQLKVTLNRRQNSLQRFPLFALEEGFSHFENEDTLLLAYARAQRTAESAVFRWGLPRIVDFLRLLGLGADQNEAFTAAFGESLDSFEQSLDVARR